MNVLSSTSINGLQVVPRINSGTGVPINEIYPGMLAFPLNDQVPPELKDYMLHFWWDMTKLHALPLPTQVLSISDLCWHLDLPWWRHEGRFFSLTPRQVWAAPEQYREQYMRTMNADLRYPIIVRRQGDRFVIMDGLHRLLKAAMRGEQALPVRLFSDQYIPAIARRTTE